MKDSKALIAEMRLEEKASLLSGSDQWHTQAVERLGIPALRLSDGPSGLRYIGEDRKAAPAAAVPTGSAIGASFDPSLAEAIGRCLGRQAREKGVHTLLGPAVNMKRSPLCGRNFEYYSEDPYLAGKLGAAMTRGIQSQGVGACMKHFAANNQETERMSVSAQVDEETLREIYLAAFETIVKEASPHTVMCSYNRINGVYSCENPRLLDDVLRKEWGFDGIVMTDWAAMNDRVRALRAGLELEMPSSGGVNDRKIVEAVQNGSLDEAVLDRAAERLLAWIRKETEAPPPAEAPEEDDGELMVRAAAECAVLLKNDGVLPLRKGQRVAVIGGFAAHPRFQGGGSGNVNASCPSAMSYLRDLPGITYSEGFPADGDTMEESALREAVEAAKNAEAAVIFAGLPDSYESEGKDRTTLEIPACQNRLIHEVCKVQPRTVVVFHAGSPVFMPWRDEAAGLLYLYLGGQGAGRAAAELLFGERNPSGRLAESFPLRLEDTPCWLDFPGYDGEVRYSEGVYIGYRWYDKRAIELQYPFGYGLSYTDFSYGEPEVSSDSVCDRDTVTLRLPVTNTGSRAGHEVVQLYVAPLGKRKHPRPIKELKGFQKLYLAPGETKTARFTLNQRSFAYYSVSLGDWYVENGDYALLVGSTSLDLQEAAVIHVESTQRLPVRFSEHMTVKELRESGLEVEEAMGYLHFSPEDVGAMGLSPERLDHLNEVLDGMPIHAVVSSFRRDLGPLYDALRRIPGLENKEAIPGERKEGTVNE